MKYQIFLLIFISTIALNLNCTEKNFVEKWERPPIKVPSNNPLTEESIKLGSALFFESLLSRDTSISCQTCHLNNEAFADHLPKGEGIKGRHVERNTPTLLNIGFHPYFMIDGKFSSLEEQALAPIKEHNEFDMSPELILKRLKPYPQYKEMSIAAYGEDLSIMIIQKALANFQRELISDNSNFDKFMRNEIILSEEEMKGWQLFKSDNLNCRQCHNGYNFTNYEFENNGLNSEYTDKGRYLVTGKIKDLAKFKIPTLRNVVVTFPYMHDGSIASLEEVLDHYSSGGSNHQSKSKLINGFKITPEERSYLIAFLNTLTDQYLIDQD
ncbi:MAG: cytochrome-c peroxidase [Saprospiraceae bacterium]